MACSRTQVPSSWLDSQATSFSQHMAKQGFNTWHKSATMWKASWGLSRWATHDNTTISQIALDDIIEVCLAKEWNYFHLSRVKAQGLSQI